MDLWELFDRLDVCRQESSIAAKHQVLEDILSSENSKVFRQIAGFVYNPYRKVHIKVTDDIIFHETICDYPKFTEEEAWGAFCAMLHDLEERKITGNLARRRVAGFFARLPDQYHDYFISILNKDLKIGVARKIIEKHIPDVAPKFDVQLCPSKQWDEVTVPRGGWFVSPKIDGIRGVVGPFGADPNDKYYGYKALSRNGHELHNTEHILEEISAWSHAFYRRNSIWPVFDGEFYTHGWEMSNSIVSTSKRSHPEAGRLQYHVFDLITHTDWSRGICGAEACFRDQALSRLLANASSKIVHVPSILSVDPEEVKLLTEAFVEQGYEGSVLKGYHSMYEFKRSKAWMKYKPFHDVDVIVTKILYGRLDSDGNMFKTSDPRATGSKIVRSLVVDCGGVETQVGTGLSQEDRISLAEDPAAVIGRTITVRYQRISEDGKLIFPRFRGIRLDK